MKYGIRCVQIHPCLHWSDYIERSNALENVHYISVSPIHSLSYSSTKFVSHKFLWLFEFINCKQSYIVSIIDRAFGESYLGAWIIVKLSQQILDRADHGSDPELDLNISKRVPSNFLSKIYWLKVYFTRHHCYLHFNHF